MTAWMSGLKVIVCAGTGGVGKTTVAASLGLMAAQADRRTLVLTIDPARRLADALGVTTPTEKSEPSVVPGTNRLLSAAMIEPQVIFREFVKRSAPNSEAAQRLLGNRLFQELSSTLSGSQEFTSLDRLLSACESQEYDLIILDTPPSQHAIDFLRAPERIFSLFQESVTKWFVAKGEGALWQKVFNRGTRTAMSALEKITGGTFLTELSDFFSSVSEFQSTVSTRSIAVHRLLASAETAFVLVTAFDEAKLKEAQEFSVEIKKTGHQLRALIINRCFPQWLDLDSQSGALVGGDEAVQRLMNYHEQLREYFQKRELAYEETIRRMHKSVAVVKVPDMKGSVVGVEGLARIANCIQKTGEKERNEST